MFADESLYIINGYSKYDFIGRLPKHERSLLSVPHECAVQTGVNSQAYSSEALMKVINKGGKLVVK